LANHLHLLPPGAAAVDALGVTVHGVKRILLEELLSVVEEGVRKYPATEKEQDAH
jgi:hypothetical protein